MSSDRKHKEKPLEANREFLELNAEYFAQSFMALNEIFQSSGPMNIVCEDKKMTVAVGVRKADDDGAADVDCVLLKPQQESLRDCINTLFSEDVELA